MTLIYIFQKIKLDIVILSFNLQFCYFNILFYICLYLAILFLFFMLFFQALLFFFYKSFFQYIIKNFFNLDLNF